MVCYVYHFLQYLYTDEFLGSSAYSKEDLTQLLKLGQAYCPDEMAQICDKVVKLTFQNVFEFQKIAEELNISELNDMVSNYINRLVTYYYFLFFMYLIMIPLLIQPKS